MLQAFIYVDGVPFAGIDYDAEEPVPTSGSTAFRPGWHNYNHTTRDVLKWGGEPYAIGGMRNLSSYLGRIIDRLSDGSLTGRTVTIELQDEDKEVTP